MVVLSIVKLVSQARVPSKSEFPVTFKAPDTPRFPAELRVILEVAASLAPVINSKRVALEVELNAPSATACIAAATSTASPPEASDGA